MSVVDLTKTVIFDKSIILSNSEGLEQYETGIAGQIRFNQTSLKFEGFNCYHQYFMMALLKWVGCTGYGFSMKNSLLLNY